MTAERGPVLLEFTVPGQAAGAGSKVPMPKGRMVGKRFQAVLDKIGRPVFYVKPDSELTKPWMKKVKKHARREWAGRPPLDGALWLDVCFYELRPVTKHYFRRVSGDVLRPDAPAYPHSTSTHDRDKMVRAISDSLTQAEVIADDKRIVAGNAWKLYADDPPHKACAVIRLGLMRHQTALELGLPVGVPAGQGVLE